MSKQLKTWIREPEPFRFDNMDRTSDGFFVKLSYLYRL